MVLNRVLVTERPSLIGAGDLSIWSNWYSVWTSWMIVDIIFFSDGYTLTYLVSGPWNLVGFTSLVPMVECERLGGMDDLIGAGK